MDVEAAARALLLPLFARRGAIDGVDHGVIDARLAPHLARARAFVVEQRPVMMVLPAFPAKSPCQRKVIGRLPDRGEREALRSLAALVDDVARVHAPGAHLVICSDGSVFADAVGITDDDVAAYREALVPMIESPRISLFHLGDALPGRDALFARWARSPDEIRARAKTSPAARAQLDGIHRFLVEELVLDHPGMTRSKARALTRERAVEVVRRSDAWSRLVEDRFPHALRLSIHPQPTVSEKIGVQLVDASDAWLTPWHGVAVVRNDAIEIMKRADAEKLGARIVLDDDGRPSHMELPATTTAAA